MAIEPVVGDGKKNNSIDLFEPAIIAIISLIAVLIVIFFLRIIIIELLSPFKGILLSWTTKNEMDPFLSASTNLLYGLMLFLLASICALFKNLPGVLSDRQWLRIDGRRKDYFANGLVLGIIVFTAATFTITVINNFQSKYPFPISFQPEYLAVTLIMLVPVLAMSIGEVFLVQGFFQRMLSEKYGTIVVVFISAFIFMILELFPNNLPHLWSLTLWQVNVVFFLTGAVIAYLFIRTKSLYMPIGFLFAWNITYYFLSSIELAAGSYMSRPITSIGIYRLPFLDDFPLTDAMHITVGYGIKALFLIITLVAIWYFRNKTLEDLNLLMDRIKNAFKTFLSNLARD